MSAIALLNNILNAKFTSINDVLEIFQRISDGDFEDIDSVKIESSKTFQLLLTLIYYKLVFIANDGRVMLTEIGLMCFVRLYTFNIL
jgi:hypothetical protein